MTKRVFVLDMDDTLIDNVHDYADPILDSVREIISALGSRAPHVTHIVTREQEIDLRRRSEINPTTGKPFGYSMDRFPGTLVETYREFCLQANVEPSPEIESRLFRTGLGAFDEGLYRKNIKPGALEIVDFINHQHDVCMLLTAGDPRVQRKKIKALGQASDRFWGGIKIVDRKTPQVFQEMVNEFVGYEFYSVGNNYESDIMPALEVGFRGGLIFVETWEVIGRRQEILAKVDHSRCDVLDNISEITKYYGDSR